ESDQRQVHGVQHQLDAHEHHDRVAPYQHTNSTDREQQRGQQQIVRGCHWSRSPSSPGSSATDPDRSPISACGSGAASTPATRHRSASRLLTEVDSISSDNDSGATEPSGNSAGVATEFCVANTPSPGFGEGRSYWPRQRASTRSRCVGFPALLCRLVKANTIAPIAAVISRAEVSSNGKRYSVKINRPRPPAPPPSGAAGSSGAAGRMSSSERASAPAIRPASPTPRTAPASRCPRNTSTTESELSLPTSMSTNRNSIMTAPV